MFSLLQSHIDGTLVEVWKMRKADLVSANPKLSEAGMGCVAAAIVAHEYELEASKLSTEFKQASREGKEWPLEGFYFDWQDANERKTANAVLIDASGTRSLLYDLQEYQLGLLEPGIVIPEWTKEDTVTIPTPTPERIAAIASEVGCTVEQVQGIIDFEAGEKQDADSLEWTLRPFNIYIPGSLGPRQGYVIIATIPNAKGKGAKEYDLWRVGSPDEVEKVALVRRWSGGGMCRIHRRDGSTQETRYGKRERVPSAEGGKSRVAKERWI